MGSFGSNGEIISVKNKAIWVYPKVIGANPSERWGHSACYFNGLLYIFGGCRGGVHFNDVLVYNLTTTTWNILKTSGPGPRPRDSHSATLVGHKMFVFGGTNGSKKVNDLHVLDLVSREWARPECRGNPPCARESHTANVVNDEKLVVFGGSGEGEANYLNDLHILDLKNMEWFSPEVSGNYIPAPRDSHSSVVVGNMLFVFGGDSGDRYQGDVSVLDMTKLTWSTVDACGSSPGARAGHASVSIGTKVYILGGVGDKIYYNDIWVLDIITSSWTQLETCSQKSQGRFSHTATVSNMGIAIFGGCGEDERPLNELLILQIDSLSCRSVGNTYKEETKMFLENMDNNPKTIFVGENEDSMASRDVEELDFIPEQSFRFSSDMLHPKRRRTSNSKMPEKEPDFNEHSLSRSQQSSSSLSDHEQIPVKKTVSSSYPFSRVHHPLFRHKISTHSHYQLNNIPLNHPNQTKQEHANVICNDGCQVHCKAAESLSMEAKKFQNLIGAEVHGQVDGAFDSGYLMTATVNGKAFRGVLFASGPDLVSRGAVSGQVQSLPSAHQIAINNANAGKNNSNIGYQRLVHSLEQNQSKRSSLETRAPTSVINDLKGKSELEGVVLTLASPGSDNVKL